MRLHMKQYRRALVESRLLAAAPVRLDPTGTPDSFSAARFLSEHHDTISTHRIN